MRESSDKWRDRALVIILDEIQNLALLPNRNVVGSLIETIHKGTHGCPILLVCAGLQNSQAVFDNVGISRAVSHFTLENLTYEETRHCFSGSLKKLGYQDISRIALDEMVEASQGFPHHITCYILAAKNSTHKDLSNPDVVNDILVAGDKMRYQYYEGRLADEDINAYMRDESMVRSLRESDALNFEDISNVARNVNEKFGLECPDPKQVRNMLIQKGIFFRVAGTQEYSIQIPSFKDYLLNGRRSRDLHLLRKKFEDGQLN